MDNINLFVPKFRKEEVITQISECLDKGWTGLGFKTIEMEDKWKDYTSLSNAHFLNSNTSGLHLSFKILKDTNKWNDGDEIITSPLTFVSSNHAIKYENLKPVFADVDEYLCLDPKSVLDNLTKKTRAILFIGIGGNMGQLPQIKKICKEYDLKLILDAAHMAGTYENINEKIKHCGSGIDVSVFSFQAVKNLPTGDSGMICFNNNDYDKVARKLSWLGIDKDTYQRTNSKGNYKWEYDLVDIGYKYHGNSIMASMGIVGLKYLEEDNKRRREICDIYEEGFKDSFLDTIKVSPSTHLSSRHLYQISVPNRDQIMTYLNTQQIYPGVHYRDNTLYKMYKYGYGSCPNAHKLSQQIISLPLHMGLTDEEIKYVIKNVHKAYKIYR